MASDFKLQVVQVRDLNDFWKDNAIASRYNKLYLTERAQPYFLVRLGGPAPEGFEVEATFEKAKLVLYKKATPILGVAFTIVNSVLLLFFWLPFHELGHY